MKQYSQNSLAHPEDNDPYGHAQNSLAHPEDNDPYGHAQNSLAHPEDNDPYGYAQNSLAHPGDNDPYGYAQDPLAHSQYSLSDPPQKKRFPWAIVTVIALLMIVSTVLVLILMGGLRDNAPSQLSETPFSSTAATTVPQQDPPTPETTVAPPVSTTVPQETVVDDSVYENAVVVCRQWAENGEHSSAVKHLDQLIATYADDPRYIELREEYVLLMQQDVFVQVEQLLELGQFTDALSLLEQANIDYSCQEFSQRSNSIQEEYIQWYSTDGCTLVELGSTPRHIVDCMLSNFSQQHFWEWNDETNTLNYTPFHVETATRSDLVTFAVRFAKQQQNHVISTLRVDGSDYFAIPGSEFTFSTSRYLNIPITVQDAADNGYKTYGDYVCFPPFEQLVYCHFSVVDQLWKRPDGKYVAFFRVYEVKGKYLDPSGSIDGYSIYRKTPEQVAADTNFSYHATGVAVLNPYKYAGDDNYQLLSYMLFAPGQSPVTP